MTQGNSIHPVLGWLMVAGTVLLVLTATGAAVSLSRETQFYYHLLVILSALLLLGIALIPVLSAGPTGRTIGLVTVITVVVAGTVIAIAVPVRLLQQAYEPAGLIWSLPQDRRDSVEPLAVAGSTALVRHREPARLALIALADGRTLAEVPAGPDARFADARFAVAGDRFLIEQGGAWQAYQDGRPVWPAAIKAQQAFARDGDVTVLGSCDDDGCDLTGHNDAGDRVWQLRAGDGTTAPTADHNVHGPPDWLSADLITTDPVDRDLTLLIDGATGAALQRFDRESVYLTEAAAVAVTRNESVDSCEVRYGETSLRVGCANQDGARVLHHLLIVRDTRFGDSLIDTSDPAADRCATPPGWPRFW